MYRVTLDAGGRVTTREPLRAVGPFLRSALPANHPDAAKPPSTLGAGRGGAPITLPTRLPDLEPPAPGIRAGEWNLLSVAIDSDVIRPTLNRGLDFGAGATEDRMGFGPIALYVGSGEVRFKDLAFKDLHVKTVPVEAVSPRFRMQRLDDFYYAWGAGAGDFNRDGVLDVVSGPVLLPRPRLHQAPRAVRGAGAESHRELRADVDRLRLRFHRRRLDRRAHRREPADDLVRQPQGRESPLGGSQGAAADHRRVHRDAGSRRRWHARDPLRDGRRGRRGRHDLLRQGPPHRSHPALAGGSDLRTRARPRPRPGHRRHQRRRPHRRGAGGWVVGAARARRRRAVALSPRGVRPLGTGRGRRRGADGRLRRQRRQAATTS